MSFTWDILPGNTGCIPRTEEVRLTVHSGGVTEGIIYTLDTSTATAANNGVAGSSAAAADGATVGSIWVVALETAAAGATARFALRGHVTVTASGVAIDVSTNAVLSSDANGDVVVAAINDVVLAIGLEDIALDSTGKVWFDGCGIHLKGA